MRNIKGGHILKEQNLVTSTILLTATSFFTRTIGMISSVYLSKALGAEGMGIYEIVMSIYMTAAIFASAGLSVTVSRMIAEALGKGNSPHIMHIMKVAFTFALTTSFIASTLLFALAPQMTEFFVHDTTAATGLRFLSLSIPFITCSSCFKGYFYATKKTIYPASADILEQIVKVLLLIFLLHHYAPYGITATYSAIGIGLTIGEMVSWSYMLSLFIMDRKHIHSISSASPRKKDLFIKLIRILLPIACISYLGYIFLSIENTLIPTGLKKYNGSYSDSMGLFGMIRGMVMPILFFPSAFLTAFSTTLVPEIAKANVLKQEKRVRYTTSRVIQLTFILSLLVVTILMTYGNELGFIIYKSEEIGPLLRTLSVIVPFVYIEVIADGILKGLNKQVSCLKYSILDSIMRVILIYFLLPIKGIHGFMFVMIISCILTSTLNFNKLLESTHLKLKPINWFLKPAVAAAFSGCYSRLIINRLLRYSMGLTSKVSLGILLTVMIYIPLLFIIQTLSIEDMSWLKRQLRLLKSICVSPK
ncbi:MAG: hypothetical protein E7231_02855 [Cellulosilyticum sp.]|nr:hypothetical protein [Cellulosilyticum sp.]